MAERLEPNSRSNPLPGLVGVGYQGQSLASLVDGLHAAGVTRLIDVRASARSRAGFAKSRLREALTAAGIGYVHWPQLGNPAENRPGFGAADAELDAARATYAALLTQPATMAAVDALVAAARRETVAVLCVEADETRCHRHVLIHTARMRATEPNEPPAGDG
jgi:uncharacterized protein (DUF488 family)